MQHKGIILLVVQHKSHYLHDLQMYGKYTSNRDSKICLEKNFGDTATAKPSTNNC